MDPASDPPPRSTRSASPDATVAPKENAIQDFALKEGKVSEQDLKLLHMTDSPAEVVQLVVNSQSSLRVLDKTLADDYRELETR